MTPTIHPSCYIASTAVIIGDVTLEENVSVWDNVVLRGDIGPIRIGKNTNVQDGVIMHVTHEDGVTVGEMVSVGHGAIVHACIVEDFVIIGMNSTVLDKARVKSGSIIGAGAVVSPRTVIPEGSMALGIPAKVAKSDYVTFHDMARKNAEEYLTLKNKHIRNKYPHFKGTGQ